MKLPYFSLFVLAFCFTWLILGFSRGGKFSLRNLLILITTLAIILGLVVWAKRRQIKRHTAEASGMPTLAVYTARK
jgi:hypothetical protein